MAEGENASGFIGSIIADVIGWVFLMGWLGGMFALGYGVVSYLGARDFAQSAGILSAVASIWAYEHRISNERWERWINREQP